MGGFLGWRGRLEKMEQYPTKDLTIDPQVAEEAIKRLAPGAGLKVGVDRLRTVRQILR